ncbi:hypothetical protein EVAR_90153_1 [Eumeta japonica]|uniref:Uncharacterized protein n=1 Tax=Eumeta variegata TaxID=151549 RepID=A0A4C1Z792_EUMVA|nr:hypothetical protein EVAR_90153_1 [Eumeta japonica]
MEFTANNARKKEKERQKNLTAFSWLDNLYKVQKSLKKAPQTLTSISGRKTEEQVVAKLTETPLVRNNSIDSEDHVTYITCPYKPLEAATFKEVRKACF